MTAAFFRAVSFEAGGQPTYGDLRAVHSQRPADQEQRHSPRDREHRSVHRASASNGELRRVNALQRSRAEITEMFGTIAHRFSTYAKSGILNGSSFEARGMISTQFILTPDGWRMSVMAWDDESPGRTIPEQYKGNAPRELG
jgi:hypothetical protein